MMTYMRIGCWFMVLCFGLMAGCSLKTSYPPRKLFTLGGETAATRPALPPPAAIHDVVLRVRSFIASPPYDGTAWVYRRGPHQIETDYYNGFVAQPAKLATEDLIRWLQARRTFAQVIDSQSGIRHQWALEGRLLELSLDTTRSSQPTAVVTLQLVLLDDTSADPYVLLNKVYTERILLTGSTPDAAAVAWTDALHIVFRRFTADTVSLGDKAGSTKP